MLRTLLITGLAGTLVLAGCTDEGPTGVETTLSRSGQPGRVGDLAVSGLTDTSVTLAFTAVEDGAGEPAQYDVRRGDQPVTQGTCRSPLVGAAVGATQSCTVQGLAPATEYDFAIIAVRHDAGGERVSGQRSNGVHARTAQRGAAAVAAVEVAPANASFTVGQTGQFTATARSAAGTPLANRPFTWRSSDTTIAAVSNTGVVTARAAGSATISATTEGQQGQATVTVSGGTPPAAAAWPNQPAGFSVIADQPFSAMLTDGWAEAYNGPGLMGVAADATAPHSGSSTLRFTYPAGFAGSASPAQLYRGLPTRDRIYVGMWWRANAEWEGHPAGDNKLAYLFTNSDGSVYLTAHGTPGGPYELWVYPQFNTSNNQYLRPNVTNVPVTMGDWHRLEWLVEYTGGGNGRIRWWMDGVLIGDHQNVPLPDQRLVELKLSPVWGGAGGVKSRTDYFWFDHVRIAGL